jgi:hypothetical protein
MNGPLQLAIDMADIFDRLDIDYVLGGSLASSFLGEPRTTVDIDFAGRLSSKQLRALIGEVDTHFYVPTKSAELAVLQLTSFNLLHHESGLKVDLFVLGDLVTRALRSLDR